MTESKIMKLEELLDKNELKILLRLLKTSDWDNIRVFLNSEPTKTNLYNKGVISDYLFYFLRFKLRGVKA